MGRVFRLLLLFALLLVIGAGLLIYVAFQEDPLVEEGVELSHQDIKRAQRLLSRHDPRKLSAGERKTLVLDRQDLNLLANHLMMRFSLGGRADIFLEADRMELRASVPYPQTINWRYLNLFLNLEMVGGSPRITQLRLGGLSIPDPLAALILGELLERLYRNEDYRLAGKVVEEVRMANGRLRIGYRWQKEFAEQVRNRLLSKENRVRILGYQQRLVELSHSPKLRYRVPLSSLLQPLFAYASERSRAKGGNAADENRMLLLVLGAYVNGQGIETLAPGVLEMGLPRRHLILLRGRKDLAQHFVGSAALTATGSSALADAIGLYKEMIDARRGSGFSFTDLAADRAGTRFGELAVAESSATKVQWFLSRNADETSYMPSVDGLPEYLFEREFRRRFGGVGEPAYQRQIEEIDVRIGDCELYRG